MKRLLLLFLLISGYCFSQSSGITYQAVIYNPNGEELPGVDNPYAPLVNQSICLQFGIIDADGSIEYQEQTQVTTDAFGMVNLLIGTSTQTGGFAQGFTGIAWSADAKFLKVDLDTRGNCESFEELSNQPFTYVPFAYYSPASDIPGPQGPQGETGPQGQDGSAGPQGDTGPPGPTGATGPQGQTGPQGETGPQGQDGADGAAGPQGETGPQGEDGATGPQGETGPQGQDGSAGPQGDTGPPGPTGATGPQGQTGPQGEQGVAGEIGLKTLINTADEAPGNNCENGGAKIEVGQDTNDNGILDPTEVDDMLTQYICNGLAGEDGVDGQDGQGNANSPGTRLKPSKDYRNGYIALSEDGTTLVVSEDPLSTGSGNPFEIKVYVYKIESTRLRQIGQTLIFEGANANSNFYPSINFNGTKLHLTQSFIPGGDSFQYELVNNQWIQQGSINGIISSDFSTILNFNGEVFEFSLITNQWELTGSIPVVLNFGNIGKINSDGTIILADLNGSSARVFQKSNNNWLQMGDDINYNGISPGVPREAQLSADGLTVAFAEPMSQTNPPYYDQIKVYKFEQGVWLPLDSIDACCISGYNSGVDVLNLFDDTISYAGRYQNSNQSTGIAWFILNSYKYDGGVWQSNYLDYDQTTLFNVNTVPVRQIIERSGTLVYLKNLDQSGIYHLNIHFVD